MRARHTLLLLLVFSGLLVVAVRQLRTPTEAEVEAERRELLTLSAELVRAITIETDADTTQLVRRDDGRWYMVAPATDRADDTRVHGLLTELLPLRAIRMVAASMAERVRYRLERPTVTVKLDRATGAGMRSTVLRVGRENPAFGGYYAMVDEDTTTTSIIEAPLVENYLMRGANEYRHQQIGDYAIEDPKTVIIDTPDSRVVLERDLGARTWSIAVPIQARAHQATVNDLLRRFATQRIERYVDEAPDDLARYGLEPPSMVITIIMENDLREMLHLGSQADSTGSVYARSERRKAVFTIPASGDIELRRTLFELREKTVLDVDASTIRAFRVVTTDGELEAARRGDGWAAADDPSRRLRSVPIEQAVRNATVLEARAFIDVPEAGLRSALASPPVRVVLTPAEGDPIGIDFARHGGELYASFSPSGSLVRVDRDDADFLEALVRTPPFLDR